MLLKFSTALLTEEAARKAVPPFTKIHGHPSRGDRNATREEAMQALGVVDVPDSDHSIFTKMTLSNVIRAQAEVPASQSGSATTNMS